MHSMSQFKRPEPPIVSLDLWRELYHAAGAFQSLEPWQWMDDRHVLGMDDEHGVRLASVLGNLGEVFGLAIYRGSTGANFLLRMLRGDMAHDDPEAIFQNDAVLVDFVPRAELRKEDLSIIKAVGFKPTACKSCLLPKFVSHKSGYLPWFIDEHELRCTMVTLQKVICYAQLIRSHPTEIERHQPNEYPFFPTVLQMPLTWNQLVWHIVTPVDPPPDPRVSLPKSDLARLLKTPQKPKAVWEVSAFYTKMSVQAPPRPCYPKMGLVVDADSGLVLDVMAHEPITTMAEAAATCIFQAITKHGIRPGTIYVDSFNMALALSSLIADLKIKLIETSSLPMLRLARKSLESFAVG